MRREHSGQESVLREEIIHMAREAGLSLGHSFAWSNLERFAALIATAKEHQMIANGWRHCARGQRTTQFCGLTEQAIAAEREAIAKMFDGEVWAYDYREIAAAIRARGVAK